jgi:hypothetical protein
MAFLDPANTTALDIVTGALWKSGAIGQGQTPSTGELQGAQSELQHMLQQWQRKELLIYVTETFNLVSTGALFYTVGPAGDFALGTGYVRPEKIQSAYMIQPQITGAGLPVSYPLRELPSRDDYNDIALKNLSSFPQWFYYEPQWPLGYFYPWPIAQANIYSLYITILQLLPQSFATDGSTVFNIPYEYYNAMVLNLAVRLRSTNRIPTFAGDSLTADARDAYNLLRNSDLKIPLIKMPTQLTRRGIYNIFGDTSY